MQTPSWVPPPAENSLDLRDYLAVLRRGRRLILLCVAIFLAASIGYTFTRTKLYTGSAEVLVKPPITTTLDTSLGTVKALNIEDERQLMLSTVVAQGAVEKLGTTTTATALLKKVSVAIPLNTNVLQVHFQDPSPQAAAAGANAFANAFLQYKTDQANKDISNKVAAITGEIQSLKDTPGSAPILAALYGQLSIVKSITVDAGELIVEAQVPTKPSSPNWPVNLALAIFFGLFVGVVAAYVRERMDDHLRGRQDLEDLLGVPVMTMIPHVAAWQDPNTPYLVTSLAPRSPAAEAYRTLRTSVLVAAAQRGLKVLMVVSSVAGEGKSTTAANLAAVLAQADKRVVLISADLRRPRVHDFFGIHGDRGLSEVLEGERRPWESLKSGSIDNLWVMSSGRVAEQPTELLQSLAMQELITEQRDVVDFIVIDCPPILAVADALVLAPLVDGVLVVADAEFTPRDAVAQARSQLDQVGAPLLGGVLNNLSGTGVGYAYYSRQYGYGPPPEVTASGNGQASTWERLGRDRS